MTVGIADLPPEGMQLVGVGLAGDSDGGATWGLNLLFTAAGITVRHPHSQAESLLAWSGLDAIRCVERLVLPDWRSAAVLELISDELSLRFLLPVENVTSGQAAYLDKALPEWLARYKSAPVMAPAFAPPAPPPSVVVGTVVPPGAVATTGLLREDLRSLGSDLPGPYPGAPPDAVAWEPLGPGAQLLASAPPAVHDDGGDPISAEEVGKWEEQPPAKGKRTRVLLIVLLVVVVVIAAVYFVKKHDDSAGPVTSEAEVRAATALAASINVRARDLPADWSQTTTAAPAPPPALPSARTKAVQTLATCIQQPLTVVEGWFGTAAFASQIAAATSPTFQSGSAPTVRIFSTTRVMDLSAQDETLAAPFAAPNFGTCFGQYQAAAVAPPATAQVQAMTLSTPTGVKAFGYVTVFTLPSDSTEAVGQAFLVGGRTTTVLLFSTNGLTTPPAAFISAYGAVAGRVAKAAG